MVRLANGQEINLDVLQNAEASPNQRVRLAAAGVRRSIDDDRAERRFQQQITMQEAATRRQEAAANRESWSAPVPMQRNGETVMVQFSNRGTSRAVDGYAPVRENLPGLTAAQATAMLADLAPAYEAGQLSPEQERRFDMAHAISQRPQSYLDQETGKMVTMPALALPDYVQRALAAGQARRAGGGAVTVPTAAASGAPAMAPPAAMPMPATGDAPMAPPAPAPMPRVGNDVSVMPPMVGDQSVARTQDGRPITTTQIRPERGPAPSADPAGQQSVMGPNGERVLTNIPGGPAARQQEREDKAEVEKKNQRLQAGGIVLQNIERIFDRTQNTRQPVAGFFGPMATRIPGTAASDIQELIKTMQSEIAFGRLNQMREASPTGAALGAVTENELKLLQSTLGSLEQRQGTPQFIDELKRIGNMYLDVVHGRGSGPPRYTTSYDQRGAAPPPPPGFQVVR
jgi:hypothetical protein